MRKQALSRRDIKQIPDIKNTRRRGRCARSLRAFCDTYNPDGFWMGWSKNHRRAIARIEESVFQGALYALAMERGGGKSAICRMAVLWAISYSIVRYAFIIGATDDKAKQTLDAIQLMIRYLPEYVADFPEISHPAIALAGLANRSSGQTFNGESTLIKWSTNVLVLPTVPPPSNWPRSWELRADGKVPTAGVMVSVSGLTGEGIRGSLKTLSTGEMVRPDFVLLDDPQTPESARHPVQNTTRLSLVSADVLGMAGPGKSISAVMPCTVIERGDMIDQILDRSKHPLWRGERTGILKSMPTNLEAWDTYFALYAECAQREPPDFTDSNDHYRDHQDTLDAGAEASWPDRYEPDEVSAIQSAMHLYFRDRRSFWSEYMNRPEPPPTVAMAKRLDPSAIATRLSGLPRYEVPKEASRLVAMIDAGGGAGRGLWYAVVAFDEGFGGSVVDYGSFPRQTRAVFAADDMRPGLAELYPSLSETARLYRGLDAIAGEVLARAYPREGGGAELRVERCLVDCGWQSATVHQWCRQSAHAGILYPSKGVGRTTTSRGVSEWKARPGERVGWHWRLTISETGRGRMVQFDPDAWKTALFEKLSVQLGSRGAVTLWGKDKREHELITLHCAAESASPVTLRGATFDKWQVDVHRPDNHLLDCLTGCCVAASVQGLVWSAGAAAGAAPAPTRAPRRRVKLSDLFAQKEAERGMR